MDIGRAFQFLVLAFFLSLKAFNLTFMIKIFLYPFSWLYGLVIFFRNRFYDFNILKSKEFDIPVISIGNITVGGTGKTPHVEYLVELLSSKFEVVTLSRGYKRKTKGFRQVEPDSEVSEVGDEPLQIKRKYPGTKVVVCENRVKGIQNLLDETNETQPDVVILDDAFQHRRITPGINILLIDYNRPVKEDLLLPAGRLREGIHQMRRANMIVFSKCPDKVTPIMRRILQKDVRLKPYQNIFFTKFEYQQISPVFNAPPLDFSLLKAKHYSILIISGIASPKPVQEYLEQFGEEVEIMFFPDHHYYSGNDVLAILHRFDTFKSNNKIMVTTEKDAIRFKELSGLAVQFKKSLYYLPVKVKFLDEEKSFNKRILGYVGENKSNRRLHKRKD